MTELYASLNKGALIPADEYSTEKLSELVSPGPYRVKLSQPRNLAFHRKFFALLNIAYEAWQPDLAHLGEQVHASRERFRKDLVILAGYYDSIYSLDGSIKLEPKSISFARMDETEFSRLYSAVIDVVLQRVLRNHTKDELDAQVDRVLGFA
jgi:hypothetical protein